MEIAEDIDQKRHGSVIEIQNRTHSPLIFDGTGDIMVCL